MKRLLELLALSSVLLSGACALGEESRTATTAERQQCEAPIDRQLELIESRLRGGYGASEGERLKERRRALRTERQGCRRFPPAKGTSP